jgi:hypothetical protein
MMIWIVITVLKVKAKTMKYMITEHSGKLREFELKRLIPEEK